MKLIAPMWLRRLLVLGATAIVALQTYTLGNAKHPSKATQTTSTATFLHETTAKVTYVFDGDTIEIEGGARVRYIGMNTPELATKTAKAECFSKEAGDENRKLVLGKTVRLVSDTSNTDKYGRLLRYVYAGSVFVNDYLTRQGYAVAEPVKPDIHFAPEFIAAEKEAQRNKLGLWNSCSQL